MKRIIYEGVKLVRVEIDQMHDTGCEGCFFSQYDPREEGEVCKRPWDHKGALRCAEEFETDNWIQEGNDEDDGYFETREALYVWERDTPLELNKQTRTI